MILEKFLSKAVMGAANAFPDLQSVTEAGGHSLRVFLTITGGGIEIFRFPT